MEGEVRMWVEWWRELRCRCTAGIVDSLVAERVRAHWVNGVFVQPGLFRPGGQLGARGDQSRHTLRKDVRRGAAVRQAHRSAFQGALLNVSPPLPPLLPLQPFHIGNPQFMVSNSPAPFPHYSLRLSSPTVLHRAALAQTGLPHCHTTRCGRVLRRI